MASTVEKSIEVAAPLSAAYNQWTQFEEFPRFMEGVTEVRQLNDKRLHWVASVAGKQKEWDAEIVEQTPDTRIAWRSATGAHNEGIVDFLPTDYGGTKVTVRMTYDPEGIIENVGDALGLLSRRVEGDLQRFKEFLEARGRETGGWRGAIHGGRVEPSGGAGGATSTNLIAAAPRPSARVAGAASWAAPAARPPQTGDPSAMPDVRPFRGIRYDMAEVGALSDVVAPPYDVIGPDLQDRLYAASPYNVIRLELSREAPGDTAEDNRYTRAAATLKDWRRRGVLREDPHPSLYVYHQTFEVEGRTYTRKGFLARVRLEPFGQGRIYPHEQTLSGPKADRLALYTATGFNLSPIFGLYPDADAEVLRAVEAGLKDRTPLEATDHLGVSIGSGRCSTRPRTRPCRG
jgi:hypothetical protein